jgi:MFS family permease
MAAQTVGGRTSLVALTLANAISLLGNTVAAVAIPWFVLVTTGSAARTGLAAFAATLPLAIGALLGGTVTDRVGARLTSVVADLAGAVAIAGIPILHAADRLEFWHVIALAFLGALFDAPGQAAREALLPDVADHAGVSRERANALWTTTEHIGYVLGAPLAGLLIATAGAPAALWVDAATFLASSAAIALAVRAVRPASPQERYVHQLVEGLRFVRRERMLVAFLLLSTVGNFLIAALAPVLLPLYAQEELGGAGDLGLLIGAYGAGGLMGAAAYGVVGRRAGRRGVFVAVWAPYPVLWLALVALPPLGLAMALLFTIGLVAGLFAPLEQLVRQERTPPDLRGRTFSTYLATLTLVVPPATLAAGFAAEAFGLTATLAAFAVGNALLSTFALARVLPRL